jgi:ribosomal RNA-processing protein 17
LTGFSKRKKAKIEDKRQRAKERDHQAHLDERRKVRQTVQAVARVYTDFQARQELKERAIENEKSVRMALGLEELEEGDGDSEDDDSDEDDRMSLVLSKSG